MKTLRWILIFGVLFSAAPAVADLLTLDLDAVPGSRPEKRVLSQSVAGINRPDIEEYGEDAEEDDVDLEAVVNPPLPTPRPLCADCSSSLAVQPVGHLRAIEEHVSGFRCGGVFQSGEASWYGPGFHGRKTASGERYDMNDMTAAHRTLPLPRGKRKKQTWVKVTNRKTKKSVMVRITDRGPYHGNRVIDLSKKAMRSLAGSAGTVQVALQVCEKTGATQIADKN